MAPKIEVATKQQLDELAAKVATLEERDAANGIKIAELEKENKALISRIEALESNKSSNVLDFSKLFERKGAKSSEEIKITQGLIELNKDANKRDKNVIIIGLPNSNDPNPTNRKKHDEDVVKDLFSELSIDPNKIKRVHRFKNKDELNKSKSTPLLIELPDSSDKLYVLKSAKQLKNSNNFKRVYINPDQSESERILTKELVHKRNKLNEELNAKGDLNKPFRYGIRNNEVIKFKAATI
jgi:hypothetical protein